MHLVDAQTFNEHVILRVPPSPTPSPPSHAHPLSSIQNLDRRRSLSVHSSYSRPSLQIPPSARPQAEGSTSQDPWPASAWCSPSNSPTDSPRTQHWPSSTFLPSIHDNTGADERERRRAQAPPPPTLYADLRSNSAPVWTGHRPVPPPLSSSSRSFLASGITGAMYEFMPPPSQASMYQSSGHGRGRHNYNAEEGEVEDGEEDEKPSSPQDTRMLHPLMNMPPANASVSHLPAPSLSSYAHMTPPSMSNASRPPSNPGTNIKIVHHPATRTRQSYDEKHSCTHLSGLTFDPSGRWMYVSTERSIAEWDLGDVLGGGPMGNGRMPMWGKNVFEEAGEWA